MYRLVLYCLLALNAIATAFSFLGILRFNGWQIIFSTVFLVIVAWVTNTVLAKVFKAPTNLESVYISALILSLIIFPAKNVSDLMFLFWAAVLTMASKFILAVHKKHIFNPVAIAVFLTSISSIGSATWWVGQATMLPFVIIVATLVIRKIDRVSMTVS